MSQATIANKLELIKLLSVKKTIRTQNVLKEMYPETDQPNIHKAIGGETIFARHKYKKHLEFFELGAKYRERCVMAANRVGKTWGMGGYELALHLTGRYPDWWKGRRFEKPISAWAAGKTNETTRDILQAALLGEVETTGGHKTVTGTGLIPKSCIKKLSWKAGVPNLVDTTHIQHESGSLSTLGFKAYNQGRGAFEGTAKHVILVDEEPDLAVYNECLIRTATTNGLIMLTFTPLEGITETVLQFLPAEMRPIQEN